MSQAHPNHPTEACVERYVGDKKVLVDEVAVEEVDIEMVVDEQILSCEDQSPLLILG